MDSASYDAHVARLRTLVADAKDWSDDTGRCSFETEADGHVSPALRRAVVDGARLLRAICDGCQEIQFDLWRANPAIEENPSFDTEVLNAVAHEVESVAGTCRDEAEKLSQHHEQRAQLVLQRPVRKRKREAAARADVLYSVADLDEHAWWSVHRTVRGCAMQVEALVATMVKNQERALAGATSRRGGLTMVC